ncbi:MAG: hypothetical protein HQL24_05375 [Candidatus Omnitrophica bacterium]|nr:hypothetical protein [Candidatus Omnitrophota bacterium]
MIKEYRRQILIIILLVLLSHGLMLFNDGVYWDDWTTFHVKDSAVWTTYKNAGLPLKAFIHVTFNDFPLLYRLTILISHLGAALILFYILTTIKEIVLTDKLVLALIFGLFPVNFAKVGQVMAPHMFCVFMFFMATYLLLQYVFKKRWIYYLISCCCFFLSFQLESTIVLSIPVFMLIAYHEKLDMDLRKSLGKLKKYFFFALVPLIYWEARRLFFPPVDLFVGYNSVDLRAILRTPKYSVYSAENNLLLPIKNAFVMNLGKTDGQIYFLVLLLLAVIVYRIMKSQITIFDRKNIYFVVLGIVFYNLAILPYVAVGRGGWDYGWGWRTRDQILVPLGAAFIILYGLKVLFNRLRLKRNILEILLSLLLAGFFLSNVKNCLVFQRAWFKQVSFIEAMKRDDVVRNHTTFLVDDRTKRLNVLDEPWRFYEFTGMLKAAFGDEKRFAVDKDEARNRAMFEEIKQKYAKLSPYPDYNMSDYLWHDPEYLMTVEFGEERISLRETFSLIFMKYINPDSYRDHIRRMIKIKCTPLA